MYQGWKNKMSCRSSFCFMEQNCDVRGKMREFLWLLRIEEKIEKMCAPWLRVVRAIFLLLRTPLSLSRDSKTAICPRLRPPETKSSSRSTP